VIRTTVGKVEEVMTAAHLPLKSEQRETRARNLLKEIGKSRKAGRSIVKMREEPTMVRINRNSQMVTAQDYQELQLQVEVKTVVLS
jgi:hypothetical protein